MGFNTTVKIINDALDQIEKHPEEFVRGLMEHYYDGGTFGVGNHANPVQVAPSRHADNFCLYSVQGNSLIELSPYSRETMEIAERLPDLMEGVISQARYQLEILEEAMERAKERA